MSMLLLFWDLQRGAFQELEKDAILFFFCIVYNPNTGKTHIFLDANFANELFSTLMLWE